MALLWRLRPMLPVSKQTRAAYITYAPPGAKLKAGTRLKVTREELRDLICSGYVVVDLEDAMISPPENAMIKRRRAQWR